MRIATAILFFICALSQVNAQEIVGYFSDQPDSFSEYAVYVGKKKKLNLGFSYIQTHVVSTKPAEKGKIVTIEHKILNKRKKVSNIIKAMGMGEGLLMPTTIDEKGGYYLTHDFILGYGKNMKRKGYIFYVPAQLNVGDTLQSGKQMLSCQLMGRTSQILVTYSDVKVVSEELLNTSAGEFPCVKIEGKVNIDDLKNDRTSMEGTVTYWMSKGIGVVKYLNTLNSSYTIELESVK